MNRHRNFGEILRELDADGISPAQLLQESVIPAGQFAGAIAKYPMRFKAGTTTYQNPNYVAHWYFANVCLCHFVDTQRSMVRAGSQISLPGTGR